MDVGRMVTAFEEPLTSLAGKKWIYLNYIFRSQYTYNLYSETLVLELNLFLNVIWNLNCFPDRNLCDMFNLFPNTCAACLSSSWQTLPLLRWLLHISSSEAIYPKKMYWMNFVPQDCTDHAGILFVNGLVGEVIQSDTLPTIMKVIITLGHLASKSSGNIQLCNSKFIERDRWLGITTDCENCWRWGFSKGSQ